MYQTIADFVEAEIVEKKSKFIAHLCYVNSEEMAEQEYQKICKKYHDARHHCYAYRIQKEDEVCAKSSDDGEPSGTAGAPMLNLLVQNNLSNVLLVVTRYFGGILLGTGGLVRAYTEASKKFQLILTKAEYVDIQNVEKSKLKIESTKILEEKYIRKRDVTDNGKK